MTPAQMRRWATDMEAAYPDTMGHADRMRAEANLLEEQSAA